MLLRVVRVSGWSGPRTRTWSGSSSWNRRSAPAGSPHSAGPARDVAADGQGVGVVRAQDPHLVGQQLPGTGAVPRPGPRTRRSRTRCCCGWSGCRGGPGPGPAPGRAAAPGTGAAPPPDPRTCRSSTAMLLRVVRVSGWSSPWMRRRKGSSWLPWWRAGGIRRACRSQRRGCGAGAAGRHRRQRVCGRARLGAG